MTQRKRIFVREYIKHGDGPKAAVAAGYKKTSARSRASKLLNDREIQEAVVAAQAPALVKAQFSSESHLAELARLRACAEKAGQYGAAIKAEELRGKVSGFYIERQQLEVTTLPTLRIVRE